MAREIDNVQTFTHKISPWSLEKEKVVMRCDDGAIYEFERPTDEPNFELRCRYQPDGTLSTASGRLPSAIKETAGALFDNFKSQ